MRRKDREITNKKDMLEILDSCRVCRLGLADGGQPYVLPLNYGYDWPEEETLTMYFHSARAGRKLDIIAQNSRACFELDCNHKLVRGEHACDYSFGYASLIGFGRARIIIDAEEKQRALVRIMERQAGHGTYAFTETELKSVTVFCVEAAEVTGKRNKKE